MSNKKHSSPSHETKDKNGATVKLGSKVRVLHIRSSVVARLSPEEIIDVRSMCGEIFEVYEVDEWGSAWVKKCWTQEKEKGMTSSHSLALTPDEMELVGKKNMGSAR